MEAFIPLIGAIVEIVLKELAKNDEKNREKYELAAKLGKDFIERLPSYMEYANKYKAGALTLDDIVIVPLDELKAEIDAEYEAENAI